LDSAWSISVASSESATQVSIYRARHTRTQRTCRGGLNFGHQRLIVLRERLCFPRKSFDLVFGEGIEIVLVGNEECSLA